MTSPTRKYYVAATAAFVVLLGTGTAFATSETTNHGSPAVGLSPGGTANRTYAHALGENVEPRAAAHQSGGTSTRPQFRLDDTQARRNALINAWDECLLMHGAHRSTSSRYQTAAARTSGDIYVANPVPAKAETACVNKLPMMPPQLEASSNPHFHQDSLAYVACMQKKGLYVTLLNGQNTDWTFTPGHSVPSNYATIDHACELTAFGQH
jgi:hypothetical protein